MSVRRRPGRTPAVVLAAVLAGLLAGCAGTQAPEVEATAPAASPAVEVDEPTTIRIASLTGPTTMGLVGLMQDAAEGTATHDYQVTVYGTPDEVVPQVVQGEVDVALLPANLAAVLHARTAGTPGEVQVAAINTLGMLEVLEAGETVDTFADLEGRTVISTGKGASPEHVLNHLLTSSGLTPGADVSVDYRSEATEVAAILASEPGTIAVLPQPYATAVKAKSPGIRTALSLADVWADVVPGSQMVTGVVVVRADFATANRAAVDDFLTDYEASTAFTNDEPAQAAALIVEAGIVASAEIAEAAIPACRITFVEGEEMRAALGGYLEVLADADPASVGGSVPGDDFYYDR